MEHLLKVLLLITFSNLVFATKPCAIAIQERIAQSPLQFGDLRQAEIDKIQAAANTLGADIYVVGSAAKGKRRNVDTELPFAQFGKPKEGTKSDIDYVVADGLDVQADKLGLPDIDTGFGVRGVNYVNFNTTPAIRFSPGKAPEYIPQGTPRIWLTEKP